MNAPKDILAFAERWQKKAKQYGNESLPDVFDHFFSTFVLYNFLYNRVSMTNNYPHNGDKAKATKSIRKYLGSEMIFKEKVIQRNAKTIQGHILDGTFYIQDSIWDSQKIEKLESPDKETWTKGLMEIIYQIRCNTFHGAKDFNESQKLILIPCIKIIEKINGMVIERLKL